MNKKKNIAAVKAHATAYVDTPEQVRALVQAARDSWHQGAYAEGLVHAQDALAMAQRVRDKAGEASASKLCGVCSSTLGEYRAANEYFQAALVISTALNNRVECVANLNNMSIVYLRLDDVENAVRYGLEALRGSEELGNDLTMAQACSNLAMFYVELGNHDEAIRHAERALGLYKKTGNQADMVTPLEHIGNAHRARGQYAIARSYYQRALVIAESTNNNRMRASILLNLAVVHLADNLHEPAATLAHEALTLYEGMEYPRCVMECLDVLGEVARMRGDFTKAHALYTRALALADKIGLVKYRVTTFRKLAQMHEAQHEYARACDYWRKAFSLRENAYTTEKSHVAEAIRTRYESEKREHEAELHRVKHIELVAAHTDLEQRMALIDFMCHVSSELIHLDPAAIDPVIVRMLETVARFAQAERGYICLLSGSGWCYQLAYAWRTADAPAPVDVLDKLNAGALADTLKELGGGQPVFVADLRGADLQHILPTVQSLFFVPLHVAGVFIGFVGFDTVTPALAFRDGVASAFTLTTQLIASALARKQAERRLRESERFLHNVTNSLAHPFFVKDRQHRWVMVNDAACAFLNLPRSALLGKTDMDYSPPEEARAFYAADEQVFATHVLHATEEPHTSNQGEQRIIVTQKSYFKDESGEYILAFLTDITEQRRQQEHMRQAQKLEAIGQLAGGIAHDFNNLLTGILGYASILKIEAEPGSFTHEAACTIEHAAQRAAQLTSQLLGFARRGKLLSVAVDVHASITAVCTLLSHTIDKKITLVQRCDAPRATVIGDPAQLEQVILNLAVNARDAIAGGGVLSISTDGALLDEEFCRTQLAATPGNYLVLRVTDTGDGIPPAIRERIFEPFFTTKEAGKGTGMGLAMVYGIVKNHGGFIDVESEVGAGSTFAVYLPLAHADAVRDVVTLHMTPATTPRCILVVDDDDIVRMAAVRMLDQLGYRVLAADSGRTALELYRAQQHLIDLVLIDQVMPDLDGRETISAMQQINPGVRAVLSSGYMQDAQLSALLDDTIVLFLQKPYTITSLSQSIEQALQRRK